MAAFQPIFKLRSCAEGIQYWKHHQSCNCQPPNWTGLTNSEKLFRISQHFSFEFTTICKRLRVKVLWFLPEKKDIYIRTYYIGMFCRTALLQGNGTKRQEKYQISRAYCDRGPLWNYSLKTPSYGIWGWRPRICKIFEITRTIYSNSERSEQFLVTECFFDLFLEVSHIW